MTTWFPVLAFIAGYRGTDWVFRVKGVALPFEPTGVAVGAALAFWALGIVGLIKRFVHRKGKGDLMKKLFSIALIFLGVMASGALFAADDGDGNAPVLRSDSEKLDLILNKLEEIKMELQIVKIRATQK